MSVCVYPEGIASEKTYYYTSIIKAYAYGIFKDAYAILFK